MIELKNITRKYKVGDEILIALDDISLNIADGEFLAIMGPSGSGKSTLANIIGGLDKPTEGTVSVNDELLSTFKDKRLSKYRNQKIGFVFQSFNLKMNFTSLENVMVPLLFSRVKHRERVERAKKALTAVGLADRMGHKANMLSGGQRQRVSIARALVNNPKIIIADEPTGNLDSKKGAEILNILLNLNKRFGITIIMITHDQTIASKAKKKIKMMDGKLVR